MLADHDCIRIIRQYNHIVNALSKFLIPRLNYLHIICKINNEKVSFITTKISLICAVISN